MALTDKDGIQGIGGGVTNEQTRDGHSEVLADHSTDVQERESGR